ncbi:hypothetical protein Hanom_Chr17g01538291 [Helianthus anomalus]
MARFQSFWIQMRKNKPLDESRKTNQTSRTKMAFYSFIYKDKVLKSNTPNINKCKVEACLPMMDKVEFSAGVIIR